MEPAGLVLSGHRLKCPGLLLQKLQEELDGLRSSLGDVSRRCVRFFEEKPSSSSVPALRSELTQAVDKMDKLHNLSSVYLEKSVALYTVNKLNVRPL